MECASATSSKRKRDEDIQVEEGDSGQQAGTSEKAEETPIEEKPKAMAPPSTKLKASLVHAQWWYYQDSASALQGPFYPGQMAAWFQDGFFPISLCVGPSFQGEVPQGFHSIAALFEEPMHMCPARVCTWECFPRAFVPGPGIANLPPQDPSLKIEREPTRDEVIRQLSSFKAASYMDRKGR